MKQLAVEMVRIAVIAQIQPHYLETTVEKLLAERKNVEGVGATFPTVKEHSDPARALGRAGVETLQANAIPAVQQNRLLRRDHPGCPPRDRAPTRAGAGQHRLQVSVP